MKNRHCTCYITQRNYLLQVRKGIYISALINMLTMLLVVCYRKTVGECSCILDYDGKDDAVMNVDRRHLVHHQLLYHYLHLMMEGRNPLAAFGR